MNCIVCNVTGILDGSENCSDKSFVAVFEH